MDWLEIHAAFLCYGDWRESHSTLKIVSNKIIRWTAAGMGALFLHRLAFAIAYRDTDPAANLGVIFSQFKLGFLFDLAALPIAVGPAILCAPLYLFSHSNLLRHRIGFVYHILPRIIELLAYIWFGIINCLLISSSFNFAINSKHLGWEFFTYFSDILIILSGVFRQHPILTILYLCIPLLFLAAGWHTLFARRSGRDSTHPHLQSKVGTEKEKPETFLKGIPGKHSFSQIFSSHPLPAAIFLEIVIVIIFVIFMRGGFQENPLRVAEAVRTTSSYLNSLPLNGIATVLQDSQEGLEFQRYYPVKKNIRFVQNLLDDKNAFISAKYPLLRRMKKRRPFGGKKRPNIVLVILESFSAKFLTQYGGPANIAPNLNRLLEEGASFRRFFASGGRSANGLVCMLAGIPDRAGRTLFRSSQIQNHFGGLPRLLSKKGYRTLFLHGGDLKFDNLDRVMPHLGFQEVYGKRALAKTGRYGKGAVWGYHDEDAFAMLDGLLRQKSDRPFFATIFTVNTHHPYALPSKKHEFFGNDVRERAFLNSYRYTDYALGKFMRQAKSRSYFKDTFFLFVADHAHHAGLNYLQDRMIPFLMYAPGRIRPQKIDRIASQLDILPTILALAGGDVAYAAMGSDLNQNTFKKREFAYFSGGSNTDAVGFIEKERLVIVSLHGGIPVLLRSRHPASRGNLYGQERKLAHELKTRALHFHQFARYLEKENLIFMASEFNRRAHSGYHP